MPRHRAASGHEPPSPVSCCASPLCPMPSLPFPSALLHRLLSAPCGTAGAAELLSRAPCAGQQNPKELEEGAGGPGWDAMAIPRDPQHGLSCLKGPLGVCLSTGVTGLRGRAALDGTRGRVSEPLGRQSLRGGEGCNEEMGVNRINWWVPCIKNTSISDEGSGHGDICCDLHTIPKATVR